MRTCEGYVTRPGMPKFPRSVKLVSVAFMFPPKHAPDDVAITDSLL